MPRKSSENLEEVPRIWEGEGSRRSEILNASNNDYWVAGAYRYGQMPGSIPRSIGWSMPSIAWTTLGSIPWSTGSP